MYSLVMSLEEDGSLGIHKYVGTHVYKSEVLCVLDMSTCLLSLGICVYIYMCVVTHKYKNDLHLPGSVHMGTWVIM